MPFSGDAATADNRQRRKIRTYARMAPSARRGFDALAVRVIDSVAEMEVVSGRAEDTLLPAPPSHKGRVSKLMPHLP